MDSKRPVMSEDGSPRSGRSGSKRSMESRNFDPARFKGLRSVDQRRTVLFLQ